MTPERAAALYGSGGESSIRRWRDIWSAGHSVSGVTEILSVAELVARTRAEYQAAANALRRLLPPEESV
jgi:nitronate monooxygenase